MDAPVFPTQQETEGTFRSPDLMVRRVLHDDMRENFLNPPSDEPALLEAGYEYRIERLDSAWAWMQRPVGADTASWSFKGRISKLPEYVPESSPQRIVKNKVAWHILDEGFKDTPSGVCEP